MSVEKSIVRAYTLEEVRSAVYLVKGSRLD